MTYAIRFRNLLPFSLLLALLLSAFPSAYAQAPVAGHNDPYMKWLDEDVHWIITDEERADFTKLSTDQKRDAFVIAFWERRNPAPGAAENTFKEEHYQRLAYANEHFASGIPGWKTDRGRFYIMYGPPDKVLRHLRSNKPQWESIQMSDFDSEEWHWDYIEGIGRDVTLKFVDTCGCGEYRIPIEQNELRMR